MCGITANRLNIVICILIAVIFKLAAATEITVSTYMVDNSLLLPIKLPVLICHVRHTGYKEISWYKDYVLLRTGGAQPSDHVLSVKELLGVSSSVKFDHPLKLQGYYWCETDDANSGTIHDYFFRIAEVYTFVGKLLSTEDSLGDHEELSTQEKKEMKMEVYEGEMQDTLFGFVPSPSVSVTDIKPLKKGLEVRFFLYVRPLLHPRKPYDDDLEADRHQLAYVMEYLRNETTVEEYLYGSITEWTNLRGIHIQDIVLRSTLGCYEQTSVVKGNPPVEVTWPSAKIGEIVIPEDACSTENGLAVTRLCTGSFFSGAKWGNPSGMCSNPAKGTTLELKILHDEFGEEERASYIERLVTVTGHPSELGVTGLHLAVDILEELSKQAKLSIKEINGIFTVIDKMVETNRTELMSAKSTIRLTSRILKTIDNLLDSTSQERQEIKLSLQHLIVDTKYTQTLESDQHILGIAFADGRSGNSLEKGSVEFLLSNSLSPKHKSLAYFYLPLDLVKEREMELSFPCQLSMVFFKEWWLFQNPKGVLARRNYKVVPTPVMYVSVSGGPAWNLTDPVNIYFKDTSGDHIEHPVCVYYDSRLDDGAGAWSTEGCEFNGLKNGYYHCSCQHLSIFAVILSKSPSSAAKYSLGTSVYIGCGVSILALSLAVLLFFLSKNWRLTVDHSILFCLSLTFLVSIILIFISEMHFLWKPGCMVLAITFHYTVFAIFGWLLVHAIVYQLRFSKKTDVSEIPYFTLKSMLSVWGVSIIIVVVIWLSKDYSRPTEDNCWLAVAEVSKVSLIPLVTLILVTLCVNTCATYALTCRFRKDFLIGESSYGETTVKYRVTFTIFLFFVLTWLFGFFALHRRSTELRVLFSISLTLTAYYVTLFFIFQEISFWDLCRKWKQKDETEPPAVKYECKPYQDTAKDSSK